jgi:hypothetical protein
VWCVSQSVIVQPRPRGGPGQLRTVARRIREYDVFKTGVGQTVPQTIRPTLLKHTSVTMRYEPLDRI